MTETLLGEHLLVVAENEDGRLILQWRDSQHPGTKTEFCVLGIEHPMWQTIKERSEDGECLGLNGLPSGDGWKTLAMEPKH